MVIKTLAAIDELLPPLEQGIEEFVQSLRLQRETLAEMKDYLDEDYLGLVEADEVAMDLSYEIHAAQLNKIRDLVLVDQRTNTVVTHRDVGTGISQVLPVLVLAYGSEGKLIAMEQPEIHLHPALQAELVGCRRSFNRHF